MQVTLNLPDQLAQTILEQRGGQSFESRVVELLLCHPQISPESGTVTSRAEALERLMAIVKELPSGKRFNIVDLVRGWGLSAGDRRQLGKEFSSQLTKIGVLKLEGKQRDAQSFKRI